MNIEVDYNPSPKKTFFISVGLNDREAISFDYTNKGHRVIKQILRGINTEQTVNIKVSGPTAEWDIIVLENGKFIEKYHTVWKDRGVIDQVNDEIWETVWEKPMTRDLTVKLQEYSWFVSDNYEKLDGNNKKMKKLDEFLEKEVNIIGETKD